MYTLYTHTLYTHTHTHVCVCVLLLLSPLLRARISSLRSDCSEELSPHSPWAPSPRENITDHALGDNHPCWPGPFSLLARDRPSSSTSLSYGVKAGGSLPGTNHEPARWGHLSSHQGKSLAGEGKHAHGRQAAEAGSWAAVPAELPGSHELIYPFYNIHTLIWFWLLPAPKWLYSLVWFRGKFQQHFLCRFSLSQCWHSDHLMCMLCLFILLIPWEGRWQSVSCALDTYAAAISLLNVQYGGNVKFSKQNKHTPCVNWRIFCSSFWTTILLPGVGVERPSSLPVRSPAWPGCNAHSSNLFHPESDTELWSCVFLGVWWH